jgi:hypothetical protein
LLAQSKSCMAGPPTILPGNGTNYSCQANPIFCTFVLLVLYLLVCALFCATKKATVVCCFG